jgi:tetratricopeptide (TPR) repeat protein
MRRTVLIGLLAATLGSAAIAAERFDYQVRDDMFRAFGGNEAALKSALAKIDATLAADPDHAEALVWRGAAAYWRAGQAYRAGDVAGARALSTTAMADMDRALALQPRAIGVLIPRAAVLLVAARNQPDPARAHDLAMLAAASYETALVLRQPDFGKLGQHNRGEYLSGLAEAWAIAGEREKSETYLRRILAELPNSPYAERAGAKLGDWGDRHPLNCQTCH